MAARRCHAWRAGQQWMLRQASEDHRHRSCYRCWCRGSAQAPAQGGSFPGAAESAMRADNPRGPDSAGGPQAVSADAEDATGGFADAARLPRTVSGTIVDISPRRASRSLCDP